MVILATHGKERVALMPVEEARMGILCSYASGVMSRSTAMKRLGMSWYGQLVDAMQAAGLSVQVDPKRHAAMVSEIVQVFEKAAEQ